MNLFRMPAIVLGIALTATPFIVQADENSGGQLKDGTYELKFRYRFEYVDQQNFVEDALASTLRTRINFKSGEKSGFGFFVEGDYVAELGLNDFNAGGGNTPDRTQYPVVADVEGFDVNQAYIQWKTAGGSLLRGGRERIIYDNARFVGNVGWRQNEQTYDGVYFQHKAGGFDLQAAWVDQVNRIFGKDVPAGQHDNNTWLLNGARAWDGIGKLTAYYYDIDNLDAAAFSTQTYGVRFAGKHDFGGTGLAYSAEFARQEDAHNNPVDYSANYYRVDLSADLGGITPYLGYEMLGGNEDRAGAAFRTPLATLHAFNGWADKFLATPNAGLKDLFAGVKGKAGRFNWNLVWHEFNAEDGSGSFGQEIDASVGTRFAKRYGVLLKAAWFDGKRFSGYDDTTKFWVQFTAGF